jgi:hypothetical protein
MCILVALIILSQLFAELTAVMLLLILSLTGISHCASRRLCFLDAFLYDHHNKPGFVKNLLVVTMTLASRVVPGKRALSRIIFWRCRRSSTIICPAGGKGERHYRYRAASAEVVRVTFNCSGA